MNDASTKPTTAFSSQRRLPKLRATIEKRMTEESTKPRRSTSRPYAMMPPVIQANAGQSIGSRASACSSMPRKPPVKTSRARRAPSTSRPAPTMRGTTPGPTCAYPPPVGRWNEPQRTAPPRASTPAATATCPAGAFTCRLLLGERERGQDVSQALVLLLDVLAVGVAGQPEVAPVLFLERLLPGGALHALL